MIQELPDAGSLLISGGIPAVTVVATLWKVAGWMGEIRESLRTMHERVSRLEGIPERVARLEGERKAV